MSYLYKKGMEKKIQGKYLLEDIEDYCPPPHILDIFSKTYLIKKGGAETIEDLFKLSKEHMTAKVISWRGRK